MKKWISIPVIVFTLFCGCKKEKQAPEQTAPEADNIHITLVSGNNQTAATGYPLNDSIVVKVTNNGQPLQYCDVQFIGSGCNEDLYTDILTDGNGLAKYSWTMAGNVGAQTLDAVAINKSKRVDSVALSAIATTQTSAPFRSACVPNPGSNAAAIVQLSTGRLIASFPTANTSLRYSDDYGATWLPLTSFKQGNAAMLLATSPKDEIFVASYGNGIFYSPDAGVTWMSISPPGFYNGETIFGFTFTPAGRLVLTGSLNDVYISPDKGQTWANMNAGLPFGQYFLTPSEVKNGDMYVLSDYHVVYKLVNNASSWLPFSYGGSGIGNVNAILADNHGYFYEAAVNGLSVSKDNGVTFNEILSLSNFYAVNMSVQNDGNFYYGETSQGIYEINTGNQVIQAAQTNAYTPVYILAKNNKLVYITNGGIYHY